MKRVRVDVEPLPDPVGATAAAARAFTVPYAIKPDLQRSRRPQISTVTFTGSNITTTVVNQAWRESDLQAMIGIQRWSATSLVQGDHAPSPSGPPVAPEAGAFAFGAKLGFFGNNGPKWAILPNSTNTNGTAYRDGWDVGDPFGTVGTIPRPTLGASRTIWTDSQGNAIAPSAFLERAVPGISRGSWMVFDAPEATAAGLHACSTRARPRAPTTACPAARWRSRWRATAGRRCRRRRPGVPVPQHDRLRREPPARLGGPADRCTGRRPVTRRSSSTAWCSA